MDEHVVGTYRRAEPVFVGGSGALLFDHRDNEYLDFLGGIAVSALGHAHPELTAALQEQVGQLLHTSNLMRHQWTEPLAALLCELSGLDAVFFCNSGTEAVEAALKIARKYQRDCGHRDRTGFVALHGGFHGRTLGALSVTHHPPYRAPFEPLLPSTAFVPPEDESALADALSTAPAALILEPIQGEGGIRALSPHYLQVARQLCDRTGTVLIHDEVQCGVGRTGSFLAAAHADVLPDIATLAKPLAAGVPIGAVLVREQLATVLAPGDHGSTFGGGPLACRAALVVLRALRDGLQDRVVRRGAQLGEGLTKLAARHSIVTEVRGRGLMQGLRLSHGAAELQAELFRNGLIANCTAGDVVRFLPPYVITEQQVARGLALIDAALTAITDS